MKCPRDPNHKLNIRLEDPGSTHYAWLECPTCDKWIKWLSEDETNELLANDGEMDCDHKFFVLGKLTGQMFVALEEMIREIVRDEMAKANSD